MPALKDAGLHMQPLPSSPFRSTEDLTLLKRGRLRTCFQGSRGYEHIKYYLCHPTAAGEASPTPRPLSCKLHASTKLDSLPSWPRYGTGADKTRQQENPSDSATLWRTKRYLETSHTRSSNFFFSSWESVNNSLHRKYMPPTLHCYLFHVTVSM